MMGGPSCRRSSQWEGSVALSLSAAGVQARAARSMPLVAEQRHQTEPRAPSPELRAPHRPPPPPPPRSSSTRRCLLTASRNSGLMSTSVLAPRPCGRLVCGVFLLASLQHLTAGRLSNCTHPLVQEHGGFRCDPSPCRGFPQRATIHLFCEPGFHLSNKMRVSRCRHGRWIPPVPACVAVNGTRMNSENRVSDSIGSMVTTAVGVSILLLSTTACLVVKSGLYPCQAQNRRRSDQLDLMIEGLPVSLPSYEEAVYGSWGQRLPSCSTPRPTQLLLAQEAPGHQRSPSNHQSEDSQRPLLSSHSPAQPPPPYEEVQSHRRDRLSDSQLQVALSDDKNS